MIVSSRLDTAPRRPHPRTIISSRIARPPSGTRPSQRAEYGAVSVKLLRVSARAAAATGSPRTPEPTDVRDDEIRGVRRRLLRASRRAESPAAGRTAFRRCAGRHVAQHRHRQIAGLSSTPYIVRSEVHQRVSHILGVPVGDDDSPGDLVEHQLNQLGACRSRRVKR